MDLGLGNLIELKRRLLPATMLTQTTYDAAVAQVGRGVAGLFDKHCNRQFARATGAIDYFSADRTTYIASRYPIESVVGISQREGSADAWPTEDTSLIFNADYSAGLLQFGAPLGSHLSQCRLTYTGGYWYDTSETDPPSRTPAAGATLLPDDVKEAWYLQCEAEWQVRDKLGLNLIKTGLGKDEQPTPGLQSLVLIPVVKIILDGHIRFQIT